MGNFNRDHRSGGGGFRPGGGGGGFRKDFGRPGGRSPMHPATCSDCGQGCEVPFKPTFGKSVFCNDCFKKDQPENSRRSEDRGGRFERRDERRDFSRPSFRDDKPMHSALCDECGEECEVPFRPTGDKPVYCRQCFRKGGETASGSFKKPDSSKEDFEQMNRKLDRILKILEVMHSKKTFVIEKPEATTKKEDSKMVKIEEPSKFMELKKMVKKVAAIKPAVEKVPAKAAVKKSAKITKSKKAA